MALLNDPIVQGGTLMHHQMDTILKQLRQDLAHHLEPESILSVARSVGHKWRNRALNPASILHLFILQVLHGNTALEHVSLFADRLFTGSAYCQARGRLPLIFFREVLRKLVRSLIGDTHKQGLWHGHRTLLMDGSGFSMPDTPELQKRFGQPGKQAPGCGFPVAKILAMFHAGTGMLLEVVTAPLRTNDARQFGGIHPHLESGDVLVADRAACSFVHLVKLVLGGIHAVFRMHQSQIVNFTPNRPHTSNKRKHAKKGVPRSRWLKSLGVLDQLVEWSKPEDRPEWMTEEEFEALPETLVVRELRYNVGPRGFRTRTVTLVTTLLDCELYSLEELAKLYGVRWRVELNLRHLKTTMKMDVLKCKTEEGVLKELMVYAIVYNLVRIVMARAAYHQRVEVERISFVDVLRWLIQAQPGVQLPRMVVNPDRPGRFEPRVRKRRPKPFPLMHKPRCELRNDLISQAVAA
jgi:Transposase DDE domain